MTEELVRQGHEVTLFASGDSQTSARLVAGLPAGPLARARLAARLCRITSGSSELVAREAHRFDLIHFHLDYVHFPMVGRLPCPTVTTLHGRLHPPDQAAFFEAFPEVPLVSISDDQRRPIPGANWQATVHHGLPRDLHTFRDAPGSYLAFLGRVSPEKGLETAVEIARRAGLPLRVAAKIYPEERSYYDSEIEPLFEVALGRVRRRSGRPRQGRRSSATPWRPLFPIDWAEPFGLVMIEAMACGTPVVAFRRGSVPEVIERRSDGLHRG